MYAQPAYAILEPVNGIGAEPSEYSVGVPFFQEEIHSTFDAMSEILDRAVGKLRADGWIGPEQEACTRLCLEEALVNAVRHGNEGKRDRKVSLELEADKDCCFIRVYDEGTGFAPESVGLPTAEQLGGRGICLIRHYMDDVFFNEEKHCLEMTLRRKACSNREAHHE